LFEFSESFPRFAHILMFLRDLAEVMSEPFKTQRGHQALFISVHPADLVAMEWAGSDRKIPRFRLWPGTWSKKYGQTPSIRVSLRWAIWRIGKATSQTCFGLESVRKKLQRAYPEGVLSLF
jgi:hypothetical protein